MVDVRGCMVYVALEVLMVVVGCGGKVVVVAVVLV